MVIFPLSLAAALRRDMVSVIVLIEMFGGIAAAQSPTSDPNAGFVTFSAFIDRVRDATFPGFVEGLRNAKGSQFAGKDAVRVKDQAVFEEMKTHLLKLYANIRVERSFVEDNHYVDCVPVEQQPGLRSGTGFSPLASPPREKRRTPNSSGTINLALKPGKRDAFGHEIYCPQKTVPMRRVSLEEMIRFPSLQDFLSPGKTEDDGSLDGDGIRTLTGGEKHYYALGFQYIDNFGAKASLNLWSPAVSPNDNMSLSQIWVVGGKGDSKQTVEAGWQVNRDVWKTDKAVLFIFYTSENYHGGHGCYHPRCEAFVPYANNTYAGMEFPTYSSKNGVQRAITLRWQRSDKGNWWLFMNDVPLGYYPKSLFGSGQLATKATKVTFGGEATGSPASLEMGSGAPASEGSRRAAYQKNISYYSTPTTSQSAALKKYEPTPNCYTVKLYGPAGEFGTYMYFGGPRCN